MASTNQTTHYELSQYVGTDKPTYLVDYNGDMSKIDTGIYDAKLKADTNETNIGDITNLQTTNKSSLVAAVNEVNTNSSNNATHIGTLSSLTTTEKTNLVGAINEVDNEADDNKTNIGTLANLTTIEKSNLVGAINEVKTEANNNKTNIDKLNLSTFTTPTNPSITGVGVISRFDISCASNSDGSIGKVYGDMRVQCNDNNIGGNVSFATPFRPESAITINGGIIGIVDGVFVCRSYTIATDGTLTFAYNGQAGTESRYAFVNSLVFFKDFGDTPTPIN